MGGQGRTPPAPRAVGGRRRRLHGDLRGIPPRLEVSPVARPPARDHTSGSAVATFYDDYQRHLHERRWTWDDIPFYEGKGARQSIAPLHDLDYLDVYQRVYGRKMGANGIGKLREVALT